MKAVFKIPFYSFFIFIALVMGLLTPTPVMAQKQILEGPFKATVINVIDGDTVEARIQVWLQQEVVTRIRILGIDTPELKAKCAAERERAETARQTLKDLAENKTILVRDVQFDKYGGRVLGTLYTADGLNIGDALKQKNMARSYEGGTRMGWC